MKTTAKLLAALSVAAATANGALYTLNSGSGATGTGFGNSAGVAFTQGTTGIVGFGYFTIADSAITSAGSANTLVSAFVGFGATPTGTFTGPGLTGNKGTFARSSTGTVEGSAFDTRSMYVFVGNGTTFANSTEFAVLKTSFLFETADDALPTGETNVINAGNVSLLFGTPIANLQTAGTDTSTNAGFLTAPVVPEPSVALLGLLGVFGLVRRRR